MANRYWVGGTGNSNDTAHWSATSGGASGANVPTTADDVFIDSNSGLSGGTLSLVGANLDCNNFVATVGASWTMDGSVKDLSVNGNITLEAGMTMIGNGYLDFNGAGSYTITWNGANFADGQLNFYSGSALGTWTLQDSITNLKYLYMETGTLDANDFDVKSVTVDLEGWDATTAVILWMGNGTWWTKFWDNYGDEAFKPTIHAENSTIKLSNLSGQSASPYMSGGGTGSVYNNVWWVERGTGNGTCFCNNNNTFHDIRIDAGVSVTFDYGGTTTFYSLTLNGVLGSVVEITAASSNWQRTLIDNYNIIGSELITNGGFTGNDTGWTHVNAHWAYGTNDEVWDNTAGVDTGFKQTGLGVTTGHLYLKQWNITAITSGNLGLKLGNSSYNYFTTTGVKQEVATADADATLYVSVFNLVGGKIDDVSLKEVVTAPHNFVKTGGGRISVNYASITKNAGSGCEFWAGIGSTDGGSNTGWVFTQPTYDFLKAL